MIEQSNIMADGMEINMLVLRQSLAVSDIASHLHPTHDPLKTLSLELCDYRTALLHLIESCFVARK